MGESGSADGVVILGVGGPRGRDCTTLSTLDGSRTLVFVFKVRVARVGDRSPSSKVLCIDALLSVKLIGFPILMALISTALHLASVGLASVTELREIKLQSYLS